MTPGEAIHEQTEPLVVEIPPQCQPVSKGERSF
jgi:hypothetical protein